MAHPRPSVTAFGGSGLSFAESNISVSAVNYYHQHANPSNDESRAMNDLLARTSTGAFHNSEERYDPPKCYEGTRVAVIEEIKAWIAAGQEVDSKSIMWIFGPAGTGKSAIAQTLAEWLHQSGALAASFFWARGVAGRDNENSLMATLAYQLQIAFPQMRRHLAETIRDDPTIFHRSLQAQMESLIIEPLRKAFLVNQQEPSVSIPLKVIILDGLDECDNEKLGSHSRILKAISWAIRQMAKIFQTFLIPVIFLIASRPEKQIRDSFNSELLLSITRRLALDDNYLPADDIRLYLGKSFLCLKETHECGSFLSPDWPADSDVQAIVEKASGQFIYAATVVKFISSSRHRPDDQLEIIRGISSPGNQTPFAALDALYHHIFSTVAAEHIAMALEVLMICILGDSMSPSDIDSMLFYKPGTVFLVLSDLHSIVNVPKRKISHLRVSHASLGDFLMDPLRSKTLHIDKGEGNARITGYILRHLKSGSLLTGELQKAEKISFESLLFYATESKVTKELLTAFFNFDPSSWVSKAHQTNGISTDAAYRWLLDLFVWFRLQVTIIEEHFGVGMNLNIYHIRVLDALTSREMESKNLDKQCFNTAANKIKITAATHPNFGDMDSSVLRTVIGEGDQLWDGYLGFGQTKRHRFDKSRLFEFQELLRNPSGSLFVTSEMYADLSTHMANYMSRTAKILRKPSNSKGKSNGGSTKKHSRADVKRAVEMEWCIDTFPFYFSKVDYSPELANYFNTFIETLQYPGIEPVKHAVDQYNQKGKSLKKSRTLSMGSDSLESRPQKKNRMEE